MNAKNIKVVRVGQSGVTGTPDEFDGHFAKRHKGSGRVAIERPRPKLPTIKNPSMQDRIEDLGLSDNT